MVAAHIEAAYKELVERVRERGRTNGDAVDLGWRFLEKFVQLPLTLPGIEPERVLPRSSSRSSPARSPPWSAVDAAYLRFGARERGCNQGRGAAARRGRALARRGHRQRLRPRTRAATEASREALRRFVARRLSRDEEIQEIVTYADAYLDPPNPREISGCFVNVFRFLVMINTQRTIAGQATAASLDQAAKLAPSARAGRR